LESSYVPSELIGGGQFFILDTRNMISVSCHAPFE
jgi:hypothetical protein